MSNADLPDGIFRRGPSGNLYIRWKDEYGRDHKMSTGGTEIRIAKALRAKKLEEVRLRRLELALGKRQEERLRLTVCELIDRYLPEFEGQASYRNKQRYAKAFKREFGRLRIHDLQARDVLQWQRTAKHQGKTPATIQRYTAFLKKVYNLAVRDQLVEVNPLAAGRVPSQKESEGRDRIITPAEEKLIVPRLEPLDRAAFVLSLYSGMRQGEVLWLRREDIDLEQSYLTLWRTKAGKVQTVPINSAMEEALRFLMSRRVHSLLFASQRDPEQPISGSRLTQRLKAVCEELGLDEGILWHTTRHTFLTRLADGGNGAHTLRNLGRHSSITVTQRYMHPDQAAGLLAVEALCEGFEGSGFPSPPASRGHLRALP